jgi:hypothetical protein
MSALDRFRQSMVSSSYCESRLVSCEGAACATLGSFRLVCRMIVVAMVRVRGECVRVVSVRWLEVGSYTIGDAEK